MGIPLCRGLHGVWSEYLCMDCEYIKRDRAKVDASEHQNKLLEEQLDLEYSGRRRPRREPPPPPPPPASGTAYGQRGGMAIEPQ